MKAIVIWVMLVHPPTGLHHPPHQLLPTIAQAPTPNHPLSFLKGLLAGAQPNAAIILQAWMGDEVRLLEVR